MADLDTMETLFVAAAFIFQAILIVHFALRKWRFALAIRYGPVVYGLSMLAALVSILLLLNGMAWFFWFSGFLYLIWSLFGYVVEYRLKIQWRNPPRWAILGPYVFLYLATTMFYWFPLARISPPLWYVVAVLFVISTVLNVTSHKVPEGEPERIRPVQSGLK